MMKKIKLFIVKHYDSIKLGMLLGILVSQFILITKTSDSINQVVKINERIEQQIKEDNDARIESRKDNAARDLETRQFICRLIRELLRANVNQPQLDSCDGVGVTELNNNGANEDRNPVSSSNDPKPADAAKEYTSQPVRNNPTTSVPPEPDQRVTVGDILKELPNVPGSLLKGIGDLL